MSLIQCRDLSLGYEGKTVVSGLTFAVHAGDYLCIVGENGSGKSTLMKGLLHLIAPLSGEIAYGDGLVPTQIGYLPQQTERQRHFPACVYELVLSGRLNQLGLSPFYRKKDHEAARAALGELGLSGLEKKSYQELSGGQQQRVLLARALCATTSLVLLDEPVSGLDPLAMQEMYALIRRLNRERGITVIMVSHDIHSALADATHILHLGDDSWFGTRAEYSRSSFAAHFMGGVSHA